MSFIADIMDFEAGELDEEQTIALFQRLVDSGMAWQLQGSYGRAAVALIEAGLVTRRTEGPLAPLAKAAALIDDVDPEGWGR